MLRPTIGHAETYNIPTYICIPLPQVAGFLPVAFQRSLRVFHKTISHIYATRIHISTYIHTKVHLFITAACWTRLKSQSTSRLDTHTFPFHYFLCLLCCLFLSRILFLRHLARFSPFTVFTSTSSWMREAFLLHILVHMYIYM